MINYVNRSNRDQMLYDKYGSKLVVKPGQDIDSERFPDIVGNPDFILKVSYNPPVNHAPVEIPADYNMVVDMLKDIKQEIKFLRDELVILTNVVSNLKLNKLEDKPSGVDDVLFKDTTVKEVKKKPTINKVIINREEDAV